MWLLIIFSRRFEIYFLMRERNNITFSPSEKQKYISERKLPTETISSDNEI